MLRRAYLVLGAAAVIAFGGAAFAATMRDNYAYFNVNNLKSFNFVQTGYSITSGQPYGGVTAGLDKSGRGEILVKAGRQGSTSVVNWFKQQAGSGETIVCNSKGTYPKELNFAVEGTLTMQIGSSTVTCENVIVAQGSYTGSNNWWMSGPAMKGAHVGPTGAIEQSCTVSGSKLNALVVFTPATPCSSTFNIAVNFIK